MKRAGYILVILIVGAVLMFIFDRNKAVAPAPEQTGSDLSQIYSSASEGFSLKYPAGYAVDDAYKYQALGPGKDIAGVKFTIPASLATGTNLGPDSYVSVEEIPQTAHCTADLFLDQQQGAQGIKPTTITDNGRTYSFAMLSDAAAGNRYDETVYALPETNPCLAVRYFIHYGAIENYPPGAVKAFDEESLKTEFDAIRRTLALTR